MPDQFGAPPGSRYLDQRRYAVATSLEELRGPASGVVELSPSMDWSPDPSYDLDDPADAALMYQTVLNQASGAEDLERWLDGDLLRRLWPSMWLPAPLRAAWEKVFPELTQPPRALAG